MASHSHELYNPIYEQIRKLGLPYQVKETGGSVTIQITADTKYDFSHQNSKFRFKTSKTFNGSSNSNWRSPKMFKDVSTPKQTFFTLPSLEFFQLTPPPQRSSFPPPSPATSRPASTPHLPMKVSTKIYNKPTPKPMPEKPSVITFQTLPNPFRLAKRLVTFPAIPKLLMKPTSPSLTFTSGFSPTPSDSSPLPKQTLETKIEVQTDENINSVKNTEAFEAVMKVIYSGNLYERLTNGQAFKQ